MSRKLINRRHFLTLPLAAAAGAALTRLARAFALAETRQGAYVVDVGILYGLLNFHLDGTIAEQVDPVAGRYDVRAVGEGGGIANRIEASGALRDGRWRPPRGRALLPAAPAGRGRRRPDPRGRTRRRRGERDAQLRRRDVAAARGRCARGRGG